jgi:acetyl esterase/lipase
MKRVFGRHFAELGSTVSWAELMAASGLAVVAYVNVNPADDAVAVLDHVSRDASALGIDQRAISIWSCSGNVPNALGLLMRAGRARIRSAALLYGYMLDLDGSTIVKEMSKFGFVVPADGKSMDDLPTDVPLFIARAGLDEMPRLNDTIDAFVARALARNLPITVANHRAGPHAFDAVHDSDETRRILRQIVVFLREGEADA